MNKLSMQPFDFAFVPKGTPMFSDLIVLLLGDETLTETRRRDMISGLRRIAKALSRAPDDVPAFGRWLQPRLEKLSPAAMGMTTKSWQNAVSDARAAIAHCGLVERRYSRPSDLSPDWQVLWKMVLASNDPTVKLAVARFVYFLSRSDVAPDEVCDEHAFAFLEALEANEIYKSPGVAYRAAVNGWNLAGTRFPDWPQTHLSLPHRQTIHKLADDQLSSALLSDLDALIYRLAHPDPLAEGGRARPLRPATLKQYRGQLIRFASELVHAGMPAEDITDVTTMLDPEVAERGLRQMLTRTDSKPLSRRRLSRCCVATSPRYVPLCWLGGISVTTGCGFAKRAKCLRKTTSGNVLVVSRWPSPAREFRPTFSATQRPQRWRGYHPKRRG